MMDERDRRSRVSGFALGAIAGAALASTVGVVALVGVRRLAECAPGVAFNLSVFAGLMGAAALCARANGWRSLVCLVPAALALFASGLALAHAWFFGVAIERRLTVLDMTLAGTAYFFHTSLPGRGLALLLACTAFALACGAVGARSVRTASLRRVALLGAAFALGAPLFARAPSVGSPLYDSALELWEIAFTPRIAAEGAPDSRALAALSKIDGARARTAPQFAKVIVLVMETMTAEKFERERETLPATSFFRRERDRLHTYDRYFPNNQDSRTGMLNMLFARVIPYEAYSEFGVEHYRAIARTTSLVDRMRELSYRTAFAVSQTELEEVVDALRWDETLKLDPSEIAAARRERKLCFTPDEYETSCEDLALLPEVVDFVVKSPRAFVYQEFIWGHAAEYNEASGKTNTAYYSEYVDALVAELERRGVAEQTLIAITSDHGFRGKDRQHELASYRIPLLFHARRFRARSDDRLLSHVDFGALLFDAIAPPASAREANPLVVAVGPTGQGNLYIVNERGGTMLLREKLGRRQLVLRTEPWEHEPARVLATFEQYQKEFDRELARAP